MEVLWIKPGSRWMFYGRSSWDYRRIKVFLILKNIGSRKPEF